MKLIFELIRSSFPKYDSNIIDVVKNYDAGYVIMHMKGQPNNMQKNPIYDNVVNSISNFFISKIDELERINIKNIRILKLIDICGFAGISFFQKKTAPKKGPLN